MKAGFSVLVLFLGAAMAQAKIHTEEIDYKHGDVVLQGYLAYDDALTGKRPCVLIVHEWMGHNPYVRKRAEQLAELGYVAFALDMYGKGIHAKDAQEAGQMAAVYKNNRKLMRARAPLTYRVHALPKVPEVLKWRLTLQHSGPGA